MRSTMSNSRRWKEFITWWRALDDTDYPDQYALIKAINDKIDKIQGRVNDER